MNDGVQTLGEIRRKFSAKNRKVDFSPRVPITKWKMVLAHLAGKKKNVDMSEKQAV
jgi:hypothetical protein